MVYPPFDLGYIQYMTDYSDASPLSVLFAEYSMIQDTLEKLESKIYSIEKEYKDTTAEYKKRKKRLDNRAKELQSRLDDFNEALAILGETYDNGH